MTKKRADRSIRVLLKSPSVRDRVFVRCSRDETVDWFGRVALFGGEIAFLEIYDPKRGWEIMKSRGSS